MFQSIHIVNFRSHKETYIEFHPGLNLFIGANDAGKTNILRAIDWVVNNRPLGDDYRSTWGGDTWVKIGFERVAITRLRTKSKNIYILKHANGKEEKFKIGKSAKDFPQVIKDLLNISPVNIARQLDGPYLLNKSAPDVARHYNEIVNLEVIDQSISRIAGTLRQERSTLKREKVGEEALEEKLKEYDWLPLAESSLSALEKSQETIGTLKDDRINLSQYIETYKRLSEASKELNELIKYNEDVNDLLHQENEVRQRRQEKIELRKLLDEGIGLIKRKEEYQEIVKHTEVVGQLVILDNQIDKKMKRYNELFDYIKKWKELAKQISDTSASLEKLEHKYKEAMPEKCPIFDVSCKHIEKARR